MHSEECKMIQSFKKESFMKNQIFAGLAGETMMKTVSVALVSSAF